MLLHIKKIKKQRSELEIANENAAHNLRDYLRRTTDLEHVIPSLKK